MKNNTKLYDTATLQKFIDEMQVAAKKVNENYLFCPCFNSTFTEDWGYFVKESGDDINDAFDLYNELKLKYCEENGLDDIRLLVSFLKSDDFTEFVNNDT